MGVCRRRVWKEIRKTGTTFSHSVAFALGDGKRIKLLEAYLVQ